MLNPHQKVKRVLLLLFPILLFAQTLKPPSPTPFKFRTDKQSHRRSEQQIGKGNDTKTDPLVTAVKELTAEIAGDKQNNDTPPQQNAPSTEEWLKGSTVVTALATVAIAGIGILQWFTMRSQSRHMRDSLLITETAANAAKTSANALMDVERSWILPTLENRPLDIVVPPLIVTQKSIPSAQVIFTITGNTPCRITDFAIRYRLMKPAASDPAEPNLPQPPDYEMAITEKHRPWTNVTEKQVIAPSDTFLIGSFMEVDEPLSQEQSEIIGRCEMFPCVYGRVVYSDAFNRIHETRFCWIYRMGKLYPAGPGPFRSFIRGGPEEYNKTT